MKAILILDTKGFDQKVAKAVAQHLAKKLPQVEIWVTAKIRERFKALIMANETIQSLINGKLKGEFGLTNAENRVLEIIDAWISSIFVSRKQVRATAQGRISGGFRLQMVKSDWSDVVKKDAAIFITPVSERRGGAKLEWLRWLLIEGSKVIITDFHFIAKNAGRTGRGIMGFKGRWHVPYEYAGNPTRNFATETIDKLYGELETIFMEAIERVF